MNFLKFLSRLDILNFQVTYLFLLTVCFAFEVSGIFFSTIAIVTLSCIYKFVDNLMSTSNSFFHIDSFFLFNSSAVLLAICHFENSRGVVALALYVFVLESLIEFYMIQHMQIDYSNIHLTFLILCGISYSVFSITSAFILCGSESVWFHTNLGSIFFKVIYILHIYGYRQGTGFYNDFLIELGGGENPLQKNVGYHLINYLFKIIILGILLPLVFFKTFWLIVVTIIVTFIIVGTFILILIKDCKFIYHQRRNITDIEKQAIIEESITERI